MTWAEHLKANGATTEEITLLDTAPARRAFDKQMADAQAALDAANAKSVTDMTAYRETMNQWYEEKVVPDMTAANAAAVTAKANEERAKAAILAAAARDEGLKQVAINMGWPVDGVTPPARTQDAPPAGFDPSQYFKKDEIVNALTREADVIMLAQDIAAEHATLFPGQRLNFTELGQKARASKKDLKSYWEQEYKVGDARAAQSAATAKAHEDKIRAEERQKVEGEMASRYGNPMTRPPMPSTSPFAKIVPSTDNKQPWDRSDASGERVQRATEKVIKQQNQTVTN
jgi:hypothetical protein